MEKTKKFPDRREELKDPKLPVIRGQAPENRGRDHICQGPLPENRPEA